MISDPSLPPSTYSSLTSVTDLVKRKGASWFTPISIAFIFVLMNYVIAMQTSSTDSAALTINGKDVLVILSLGKRECGRA